MIVSLVSAIRGPITLITVGVLFALNNFTPYRFHQTWPVLLIVFGLLTLLRRSVEPPPPVRRQGIRRRAAVHYPPPPTSPGSYRQTPYAEPAPPSRSGEGRLRDDRRVPNDSSETPGGSV